jgi:transposase
MSSKPRRIFGREFKLQIVRQLMKGEKRLGQVCREHNLAESLVRRWREQYEQLGENVWLNEPLAVERDAEARIAELEAALGRAHLENELLRRALEKGGSATRRNGR